MDHNFVTNTEINSTVYTYVLLDVLLCSIAEYFTSCGVEPVGRVKIQSTSQNSQRYYKTKRLIRDLLSTTPNWCSWERISWIFIYRECVIEVFENVVLRHLNVNCFYHHFLTLTWRLCHWGSNSSRAHCQLK